MKTLYLLRHAKAEPGGAITPDEDRPLSARGREACVIVGEYMREQSYLPALVLSSPSARTRETLKRVLEACGGTPAVRWVRALYLASPAQIIQAIQEEGGDAASMMIVGHNPGMHHVAITLAARKPSPERTEIELKYPTGALAVLRFNISDWGDMEAGAGEIKDFVMPKEL